MVELVRDKGRVSTLDLHGHGLTKIGDLQEYKELRVLDLSCNQLCKIEGLSYNRKLQELKLYGNGILCIEGLERLTGLCQLLLQHNKIRAIGSGLAGLRRLKVLRLDHNLLSCVVQSELERCSQLTSCDLSHNCLTNVHGLASLAHVLEELNISHNQITTLPQKWSKLQVLNISYNPILPSYLHGLSCKTLKVLWVEGLMLADMSNLPAFRSLEELHAAHNRVACVQQAHDVCPNIELLDVRSNLLENVEDLCPLSHLPFLTELFITGNPLTSQNCYHSKVQSILTRVEVMDDVGTVSGQSLRALEQKLAGAMAELESSETTITEKFDRLQTLMDTCCSDTRAVSSEERPTSQCGSRARLQDALTFAREHFNTDT